MKLLILNFSFFLLIVYTVSAQKITNEDYSAYIGKYKSIAIAEMKLFRIPASITLAQGLIESGCGKSQLAIESNNHFGIKCHKEWTGETYFYDDDEKNECFRKYKHVEESYRDHSLFLTSRPRYATLFSLPAIDYIAWAKGLKQAGYATNPEYANILIRTIETHRLYLLDDTLKNQPLVAEPEITKIIPVKPINQDINTSGTVNHKGKILFYKQYKFPIPTEYQYMYTSNEGRKVYQNNNVPFVFAKKDDTWYSIAKEFEIYSFQVYKQNDLSEDDPITPGQILYLEPKKKKNQEHTYVVKNADSMYSISQEKCIKLANLLKLNKPLGDVEPVPGYVLKLRK